MTAKRKQTVPVGIALVLVELLKTGAMCPECIYGTRVVSKKWAKCKRCGRKVERREQRNA